MEPLGTATSQALSRGPESGLQTFAQKQAAAEYLDLATKLLGLRRTGTANDPEVYITAITRVLSGYPLDIARRVIDPLHGPLAKLKWLPEPAEVRAACEDLYSAQRYAQEWNARTDAQLAEREAWEAAQAEHPEVADLTSKKYGCQLDPSPDPTLVPADMAKRIEAARIRNLRAIEREYQEAGIEPVMAGQFVLSPSLLKSIGRWPPASWVTDPLRAAAPANISENCTEGA